MKTSRLASVWVAVILAMTAILLAVSALAMRVR